MRTVVRSCLLPVHVNEVCPSTDKSKVRRMSKDASAIERAAREKFKGWLQEAEAAAAAAKQDRKAPRPETTGPSLPRAPLRYRLYQRVKAWFGLMRWGLQPRRWCPAYLLCSS
jgi:hypothetical protein